MYGFVGCAEIHLMGLSPFVNFATGFACESELPSSFASPVFVPEQRIDSRTSNQVIFWIVYKNLDIQDHDETKIQVFSTPDAT